MHDTSEMNDVNEVDDMMHNVYIFLYICIYENKTNEKIYMYTFIFISISFTECVYISSKHLIRKQSKQLETTNPSETSYRFPSTNQLEPGPYCAASSGTTSDWAPQICYITIF